MCCIKPYRKEIPESYPFKQISWSFFVLQNSRNQINLLLQNYQSYLISMKGICKLMHGVHLSGPVNEECSFLRSICFMAVAETNNRCAIVRYSQVYYIMTCINKCLPQFSVIFESFENNLKCALFEVFLKYLKGVNAVWV